MRGARWGCDRLSLAEDALDAFHPQTELAGEDLETLLLAVVGARGPSRLADSINLEQFAACLSGSLPEHGPQPGDLVDELVACSGHTLSSFATLCFGPPATGSPRL